MSEISYFLAVDLETSGFKSNDSLRQILEVAAAVVRSDSLEIVYEFQRYVAAHCLKTDSELYTGSKGKLVETEDQFVSICEEGNYDFHKANGFVEAYLPAPKVDIVECEDLLIDLVSEYWKSDERVYILGSSAHFDHRWFEDRMPRFFERLSHRIINVSTIRDLAKVWLGDEAASVAPYPNNKKHHALDDCLYAVKAIREYRHRFFNQSVEKFDPSGDFFVDRNGHTWARVTGNPTPDCFIVNDPEEGLETHVSRESAERAAEGVIDAYRELVDPETDEWDEEAVTDIWVGRLHIEKRATSITLTQETEDGPKEFKDYILSEGGEL